MPLPVKPTTPVKNATHGFNTDIVGAWLFVEGTNNTIADYSGSGNHIYGIDVVPEPAWVFNPTAIGWYLDINANIFGRDADDADFNHTTAEPWTQTFWFRRAGPFSGTFARLSWRPANVVDLAMQATDNHGPAYFDGAGWVNPQQGSNVSGADEMWSFVYDGTNMKIYKGSDDNPGVTLLDSRAKSFASTGQLKFFGNGGEDMAARIYAMFYHRRALSAADLATHYSAPWEAFELAAPDRPTGLFATPNNTPQVGLGWVSPGGTVDSYKIYRALLPSTTYTNIASLVTSTIYTDSTALNNTLYFYAVTAVNAAGEGTYSSGVTAVVPPHASGSDNPYIGQVVPEYYRHDEDKYQGGSQHLLDWLAGK